MRLKEWIYLGNIIKFVQGDIMSKNKKYYWIKLNENFFDDDPMAWILEQENGKDYIIFYLMLCLRSLTTQGLLFRSVGDMLIPYDAKKLAEITKTPVDTVRVAMKLFEEVKLIEVLDTGEIYMKQINELIGSETDKARRMRVLRASRKLQEIEEGNIVTQMLPDCYEMLPRDRDKEKEIEKELDEEIDLELKNLVRNYSSKVAFRTFWLAYPRQCRKENAEKEFMSVIKDSHDFILLMNGLKTHKSSKQWEDENFIPYPENFISKKIYLVNVKQSIDKESDPIWNE